ncbi:MAG: efflux RND transporter periplasmic adaptor subunit [Treponema sp.]|jgi:multidrug efflux pump subunit AcrA (membrane-fusion protein)|nr:efflux RND transporter periplasmic adaptor subunit [Treponema sp.]
MRKTGIALMVKTAVCAAALAIIFLLPVSCGGKDLPGGPGEASVFAVSVTSAAQGQIADYLPLSGDIVSGSTVDVYSDVAGKVTRLYVDVGSYVQRGAPIAAVDPSKPGMTYVPGVAAAPISGTVISLPAQVGMTVSPAVALARIAGGAASGDMLEIKLYVAERFISKIALNESCEISLDAWPGEIFRGSVTEISPIVDPASRTMEVKVNVDNPGAKLKAGMFAKVKVITEQKEGIVKIPAGAMIQRFGENYVFVVEELSPQEAAGAEAAEQAPEKKGFFASLFGKKREAAAPEPDDAPAKRYAARKRIVKPGILIDQILEVQEGLKAGEEVIVRGQTLLEDGARVNVVDRVQPLDSGL